MAVLKRISFRRRVLELMFPWLRWRREARVKEEIRRLVIDAPDEEVRFPDLE